VGLHDLVGARRQEVPGPGRVHSEGSHGVGTHRSSRGATRAGREASEGLFAAWWDFRQRTIDRAALRAALDPVAHDLRAGPERGHGCGDAKAATFCENLLVLYPALWLFAGARGRADEQSCR
jgi:hypothetical protein